MSNTTELDLDEAQVRAARGVMSAQEMLRLVAEVRRLRQLQEQSGGSLAKTEMEWLRNRVDGARLREADAVQWLRDRDAAEAKLTKIRAVLAPVETDDACVVACVDIARILDGEPQP